MKNFGKNNQLKKTKAGRWIERCAWAFKLPLRASPTNQPLTRVKKKLAG